MPHSWTCALPFLFNLDDASGFELAQSTPSRVLSQAGGSQSRTPKQDWVLATLRKDHAIEFDQRHPSGAVNPAPIELKSSVVRNAGERLLRSRPAQRM
jgi:hypothetical protein